MPVRASGRRGARFALGGGSGWGGVGGRLVGASGVFGGGRGRVVVGAGSCGCVGVVRGLGGTEKGGWCVTFGCSPASARPGDGVIAPFRGGRGAGRGVKVTRRPPFFGGRPVRARGGDGCGGRDGWDGCGSLSMFLCKRVRSEMGVDSVGVGGGEPGGPAGGALRLVVTCPSTSLPLALREWAGVFFSLARSAARRSSMLQTRRPQQFGPPPRRRGSGRASRRTARLGGSATRSRWWCRGDPAQGRGEGQEGGVPLPGPLPRPPPSGGARGPGSDWRKAPGARRAASSSGAVQARAQGGGDPLAVPVGDEPHGGADQVDHAGGDHGVGPGRPGRPRAGRPARRSTRSARP